jgi:hypothetical protein
MMPSVDINWWAVIVAAIINMAIGSVWYMPSVFGKAWKKASKSEMKGDNKAYFITAIAALVQSWVLVHFVRFAGSTTFWKGLVTGFWLWVAFVAAVMLTTVLFEGRSWMIWRINAGYWLVVLLINGGLLAAWR